jgi:hypothetical protein
VNVREKFTVSGKLFVVRVIIVENSTEPGVFVLAVLPQPKLPFQGLSQWKTINLSAVFDNENAGHVRCHVANVSRSRNRRRRVRKDVKELDGCYRTC